MSKRTLSKALCFLLICLWAGSSSQAQCPGGTTQSQLNWDYLDYLPSNSATYYTPFFVSGITPYNQNFSMGPRRLNFTVAPAANIVLNGENSTHTGHGSSFATAGDDVQFTTTNIANTSITMTFDIDVSNVMFSIFDLDINQVATITATDAAAVAQNITAVKANAASAIVIAGSGTPVVVATGPAAGYLSNNNGGTVNVTVAGPVQTITITLSVATGDIWLSDIDACVTGSFTNNWRNISQPFAGMPSYILTVMDSTFYVLDPATGRAGLLYQDPGNEYINGMAYDPINRVLYYCYTQTGTATRTFFKYELDTETRSTWVADINTAPLNIPTYTQGVESGSASFYDGYLYIGIEGNKTSPSPANQTGRENTVWKVELDASQNPVRASQLYAARVDSNISGSNRLVHDWSDIGITNGGMLYDFDGAPSSQSDWYHFNMMTGQRDAFPGPSTAGIDYPRQVAIDWNENVYNMGNIGNSPSNGFIVPYNYDGTVNTALNQTVVLYPGAITLNGNFGDCSEAFRPYCDFGDAPASYDPDPLSPAVHERDTALHIGATFDREWNKTSSALADADGSDEDGLAYVPILAPGGNNYLAQVSVYNNTGEDATLIAWLDYNGNGVFDAGEVCNAQPVVPSSSSTIVRNLFWPAVPVDPSLPNGSTTYMRIRLVKTADLMDANDATGYYNNGETEDYPVLVDNFPLAVNLISFDAKLISNTHVKLDWTSAVEQNFSGFDVQRSTNTNTWTTIGTVNSTGNGLSTVNKYTFNDFQPLNGKSYYRLKMNNQDGKSRNSETRTITIADGVDYMAIYPNPANNKAFLLVNSSLNNPAQVTVTDMSGRTVYSQNVQLKIGGNNIDLPVAKFEGGVYIVRLNVNETIFTQKLIISK